MSVTLAGCVVRWHARSHRQMWVMTTAGYLVRSAPSRLSQRLTPVPRRCRDWSRSGTCQPVYTQDDRMFGPGRVVPRCPDRRMATQISRCRIVKDGDLDCISDIVMVLVVSWLLGAAARRCGQPAVVGQIIAGILLGRGVRGRLPGHLTSRLFPHAVAASRAGGLRTGLSGIGRPECRPERRPY